MIELPPSGPLSPPPGRTQTFFVCVYTLTLNQRAENLEVQTIFSDFISYKFRNISHSKTLKNKTGII